MAGRGRPTKLDAATQVRIVQAISAGNYYEAASVYGGIDYSTFRLWMQRGEAASSGLFRDFFEAVKRAEAEAEVRTVAQWQAQVPEDWRAARDFLARRYPSRWGPTEHHEVTGKDGGPMQVQDLSRLSVDDLVKLSDILERATAPDPSAGQV